MNFASATLRAAVWGSACVLPALLLAADSVAPEQLEFFENRVRPVLVQHCYGCHSEDASKLRGGLRLDLREAVLRGGDSGPAIVAGRPGDSLLIEAVRYESLEMPPKAKLPDRVISDLVKWVEMGAPDPRTGTADGEAPIDLAAASDHWAFRPIEDPLVPAVHDRSWPHSEIDWFVLSRLEEQGLRPARDADRFTWLRRVSFDLTGLPPTLAEIRDFQHDRSPSAHARVVDRLLGSRAFGERWARHWLDLVGYADQIGTSNNVFAEHAWRYRDYVVDGLNRDKPFDRFVREQIAGDLLPYASVEERAANVVATGFLLLGDLEIVEADKAKLAVDVVDQQVVKVSNAFLAMTVGCARCHDHKFDPIPQRDYYALAGFFNGTDSFYKTDRGVWSDLTTAELPETEQQRAARVRRAVEHQARLGAMREKRKETAKRKDRLDQLAGKSGREGSEKEQLEEDRRQLEKRLAELDRAIEHAEFFAPSVARAYAVRDVSQPQDMRITIRGNPRALGEEVPRGFLQIVSNSRPAIPSGRSGRAQLADWVANAGNPLTARVAVNRIWQRLFGAGLVRTVDYFGVRGEAPSHPRLLDHLAARFANNGWSRKSLIRCLVLSRVYRMSGDHNDRFHALDPDNRLLWRANRRRLDAEALRDALLAVSGELCHLAGGPSLPLEFLENVANIDPEDVNPPSFRLARWRKDQALHRTIYLPVIRSAPQPGPAEIRNVFDFTQPAEFSGQRSTTAVPTQALYLMNSPDVKKHAANLAGLLQQAPADLTVRLEWLWLHTLNRPITSEEASEASDFVQRDGWVELCHALLASNEFLMQL